MKSLKDVFDLMAKSREDIKEANFLLNGGFYAGSASSSYYAMFHSVRAILHDIDVSHEPLRPKTHSGVLSNFSLHFIKTGVFSKDMLGAIGHAQTVRQAGDYDSSASVSKAEAAKVFDDAKLFVKEIEKYIEKNIEKEKVKGKDVGQKKNRGMGF